MKIRLYHLSVLLFVFLLAACGGGSSGSETSASGDGGGSSSGGGDGGDGSDGGDGGNGGGVVEKVVAFVGEVAVFPSAEVESVSKTTIRKSSASAASYKSAAKQAQALSLNKLDEDSTEITSSDMVGTNALVSLFLLSDVNYEDPIATVATDEDGNYEVTAEDVQPFLLARGDITESSSDEDIISAFQNLGRLQVRAMVIRQDGDTNKAIAIQSIADPSNMDENGAPVPVVVNPIVHRVTKTIIDQIKQSIDSLRDLGLSAESVANLANSVITSVSDDIQRVVEEASSGIIEIPEGQSLADVIEAQENEFELDVPADELNQLAGILDGSIEATDETIASVEQGASQSEEVISDEESILEDSLDSESQGLLAGLNAALNEQVTEKFDFAVEQAEENGNLDDLLDLSGGEDASVILAAAQEAKGRLLRRTLQRFFLSMGLAVTVDENDLGSAGVIAVNLPAFAHIPNSDLPGGSGFGDRGIRIFKVGEGDLDSNSDYTTDPESVLGRIGDDGVPLAPFYYAPPLAQVVTSLYNGETLDDFQRAVNEAFGRISDPDGAPTDDDFSLIDRLRLYHELSSRLVDASLVSGNVINTLLENSDSVIKIKQLAAVVAENFTWAAEQVNLTPEAFPIFTGRLTPLSGGASTVDSSELVRQLSLTLGNSATETAQQLTEKVSFYAQFAPDAIQNAIQRASFQDGESFDLLQVLLDVYPEEVDDYFTLIAGSESFPSSPGYSRARDRIARGLTSAVPSSLFGQTLTSESSINIRSALFLMDFLLKGKYLIDSEVGYFSDFTIAGENDLQNVRKVPSYNNLKIMLPADSVTIANLISSLLDITLIQNGDLFEEASSVLQAGLNGLAELPEFKEQNIDDFADEFDERSDTVNVSCTVERFDGLDPAEGDTQNQLGLSVFAVQYNSETGEFFKGDALDVSISSGLAAQGSTLRTYTIENLPSQIDGSYGLDYVLRFDIPSYQNDLPELFFYVDGYTPTLNMCDAEYPLHIGADFTSVPIPGLGLVSDQFRPGDDGSSLAEGIDVSNFEQPGAPIYLTEQEESAGEGAIDFFFNEIADGYALNAAAQSGVGFAPLFGEYVDGELELTLDASAGSSALYGITTVMGANIRPVIEAVSETPSLLNTSIGINADEFEFDRLYLMKDSENKFWVLELRFIDVFERQGGGSQAFIDFGFAGVNSLGQIDIPEAAFDDVGGGADTDGSGDGAGVFFQNMIYGDWLVLDEPTDYSGPNLVEPQEVSFGGNDALYDSLEAATDGIVIRYAGNHFEENITSVDDFDTVFGDLADYSSIPVRIDAGRDGVSFVKLRFNEQNRSYVMEPEPENSSSFATNLRHNDLLAVFSDDAEDIDSPVYIGRVVRDRPENDPFANFEIAFEWIRFADVLANDLPEGERDPRDIVCFSEENEICPSNDPVLAFGSSPDVQVGTVFDADFDGVPALFDPNDNDPNVPGQIQTGAGGGITEGLEIVSLVESDGEGGITQSFALKTFAIYPGDIKTVLISSDIFGPDAGQQVLFTCTPPSLDGDGAFTDYQCAGAPLDGDVTINARGRSGDSVAFKLTVPAETLASLEDRIDFDYEIRYRVPTDLNGDAFLCGEEACPARPDTEGSTSVRIPDNASVFTDINVAIGTDSPAGLGDISSLDVNRDFTLSGSVITDAAEYELNIFCAGSQPGEDFKPEENLSFWAPARDGSGRVVQPEFNLNVPFIGGRSCDLTLNAHLENEAGDSVGISSITFSNVATSGGDVGGGFVDNEISLIQGESICILDNNDGVLVPTKAQCGVEDNLFTFTSVSEEQGSALITLGDNVIDAFADAGRKNLTEGQLSPDSLVAFNISLDVEQGEDITSPSCGVISTDSFSNSCVEGGVADVLTDVFKVNAEFTEMALLEGLPLDLQIEGPVSDLGSIPLDQPGFFVLIDPESGDEIVEIYIDSFITASDERNVWARFTLTAGSSEYNGEGDNTLSVSAPGFMNVGHLSGQPVDFDIRFIREDEMKVAWFLPPPRSSLAGDHDVNGDGETDLSVSYSEGLWTILFSGLDSLQQFGPEGPVSFTADENGDFSASVDESLGFTEFSLIFTDTQYNFLIHMDGGANGTAEWFEIFGGPGGPGDGPDGCPDCPVALFDAKVQAGESIVLSRSDEGYNDNDEGDNLLTVTVNEDAIIVSLPEGSEAELGFYSDASGEFETTTSVTFNRGQDFPYFVDFIDERSSFVNIELFDTGVDVVLRVYEFESPVCEGEDCDNPDMEFDIADLDGDGIPDAVDNCIVIANPSQDDGNDNGLGDVCDVDVPDMSGLFLASAIHDVNSQYFDDEFSSCVAEEDEVAFLHVEMQGNQILIFIGDDQDEIAMSGVMASDASFQLFNSQQTFFADGTYSTDQASFAFDFTDTHEGGLDEPTCISMASVSALPPTPVNEQDEFELGVNWFEADEEFDFIEFEYGRIQLGSVEQAFFYDLESSFPEWVELSAEDLGQDYYLTDSGVVMSDDLLTVIGFESEGENAQLQPTSGGSALDVALQQLELEAFDVASLPVSSLLGEAYQEGLPSDLVFSTGALAYSAHISNKQEAYNFWCDDDGLELDLECRNVILIGELSTPAIALNDIVFTDADMNTSASVSGLWVGAGVDEDGIPFDLQAVLVSDNGDIDGANLQVSFVKHLHDDSGSREIDISVSVTAVTLDAITVYEFHIPDELVAQIGLDEEDRIPFIFEESELDGTPLVRQGRKRVIGIETDTILFNDIARDDILDNFNFVAPSDPFESPF